MRAVLSEQHLELVNALQIAPRAPWSRLAEILGCKPITISHRWEELHIQGQSWVTAMASGAARHSAIGFVEVNCTMDQQESLGKQFVGTAAIASVEQLTQGPNFGLTVVAESLEAMSSGPLNTLARLQGVTRVQTSACIAMHHGAHKWRLGHLDMSQIEALETINRETTETDPSIVLGPESQEIVRLLQHDGRCSAAKIARELDLSPATARRRLDKVLHSEAIALRTEIAQSQSGWPVNVQWFTRLPAGEHSNAAARLSKLNPRMVASCTGSSNMLISFWLRSLHDVLSMEQEIELAVPAITIDHSAVLFNGLKRQGWVLNSDGTTTGDFIADTGQ